MVNSAEQGTQLIIDDGVRVPFQRADGGRDKRLRSRPSLTLDRALEAFTAWGALLADDGLGQIGNPRVRADHVVN